MVDLSEVRKRAWKTRREKYGSRGHSGAYMCGSGSSITSHYRNVLAQLHNDGVLSEGQAVDALLMDRIQVRTLADEVSEKYGTLRNVLKGLKK